MWKQPNIRWHRQHHTRMAETLLFLPWSSGAALRRLCPVWGRSWRWGARCLAATPSALWYEPPAVPGASWSLGKGPSEGFPKQRLYHQLAKTSCWLTGCAGKKWVLNALRGFSERRQKRWEKKGKRVSDRTPCVKIPSCKVAYQSIHTRPLIIYLQKSADQ